MATCRHCGKDGLNWVEGSSGRPYLAQGPYRPHTCAEKRKARLEAAQTRERAVLRGYGTGYGTAQTGITSAPLNGDQFGGGASEGGDGGEAAP